MHNVKECKASYYTKRKLKKNKSMLLGVEVTMESISDKNFYASQSNAKVIDSEGHTFKYSFYGKCEPRFRSSGALNKGEKVKGWMTFEVPTKATGLKFAYQPLASFRGPKQILKFDLGR